MLSCLGARSHRRPLVSVPVLSAPIPPITLYMGQASPESPLRTQFMPPPPLQYPESDDEETFPHHGYTCCICGTYRTHFVQDCPASRCHWCNGMGHSSIHCTKEADEPADEYICKICDVMGQHFAHHCPESTCSRCKSKGHLANVCSTAVSGNKVPADYTCSICNSVGDHYYHQCPEAVCKFCGAKGHISTRCDRDISRCICKMQMQHRICNATTCRFAHLSSPGLFRVCALVRQACCQFPDEWGQVARTIGGKDHHGAMLAFDAVYSSLPKAQQSQERMALLDRVRNAPDGKAIIMTLVAIQEEFTSMGGRATLCAVARKPQAAQSSVAASSSQLPPGLLGVERVVPVALECPLCFEPCTFKSTLSSSQPGLAQVLSLTYSLLT